MWHLQSVSPSLPLTFTHSLSLSLSLSVYQIQELVFRELSRQISDKLIRSVDYLRESVVGTLRRCLEKLEDSVSGDLKQLEMRHSGRLKETEEHRDTIRKV